MGKALLGKISKKYRAVFFDRLVWFALVALLLFLLLAARLACLQLGAGVLP